MTKEEIISELKKLWFHEFKDSMDEWYLVSGFLESNLTDLTAENTRLREALEKILPDGDTINKAVDDYGFRVPYDGSNKFYDEEAMKHFLAGVRFVEHHVEETTQALNPDNSK